MQERGAETPTVRQVVIWVTTLVAVVVSFPDAILFSRVLFGPIGEFGPLLVDLAAIGLGVGLSRRVEPGTAGRWVAGVGIVGGILAVGLWLFGYGQAHGWVGAA